MNRVEKWKKKEKKRRNERKLRKTPINEIENTSKNMDRSKNSH